MVILSPNLNQQSESNRKKIASHGNVVEKLTRLSKTAEGELKRVSGNTLQILSVESLFILSPRELIACR